MTHAQGTRARTIRALAPDLARGLMLLLIAIANIPWSLWGVERAFMNPHSLDASTADRVWQCIAIVVIDARSYPLFAFLFGYGIWQLYARQKAAGVSAREARSLLQRRHWWMLAFGAVHAALLWDGDIIGVYGLIGLLITWLFLERTNKTLGIWSVTLVSVFAVIAVASIVGGHVVAAVGAGSEVSATDATFAPQSNYSATIIPRLSFWAMASVGQAIFGFVVPSAIMIALVSARHRILESPQAHRSLLKRTALVGVSVGWLGGIPQAIVHVSGYVGVEQWTWSLLHMVTGLFGALGYAAVFALIADAIAKRGIGPISRGIVAVGKRSLTNYLLQSVLIIPVFAPWGFGLGAALTEWQAVLYAVGVWVITLVFSVVLERLGKRGPLEWLLRRLSYRRIDAPPTPVAFRAVPHSDSAPSPPSA